MWQWRKTERLWQSGQTMKPNGAWKLAKPGPHGVLARAHCVGVTSVMGQRHWPAAQPGRGGPPVAFGVKPSQALLHACRHGLCTWACCMRYDTYRRAAEFHAVLATYQMLRSALAGRVPGKAPPWAGVAGQRRLGCSISEP